MRLRHRRQRARIGARELLPDSPADGLVEFDAALMADTCLELARAAIEQHGPVAARRHLQSARLDDRVGPRDRRTDRSRDRLAGPPHGRPVPRVARATGCGSRRTSRRRRCNGCSTSSPIAARAETLCFGTVETWIAWALSEGTAHVTDASNSAVTGLQVLATPEAWDTRTLDGARHSRHDAADDRRLVGDRR